ncbi:hypothetical protein L195_g008173 [Trifolium pratense]|uniref:Endonuclease/exonuclease/phosphatase domain-containing protein n=1 Tax=Trifolium pratense TaxID=57577 RepID=A0A2K3P8G1_TRIPR|nr:hypothetical protein L195_g008173 [Trifolium pratense]
MSKKGFGGGKWCIAGDFNSISSVEERRGLSQGTSPTSEMREFRSFVEDLELEDLPLLGRRFTWFHSNGRAMSRIDRFLVSPEWQSNWGPNLLFNNAWLEHRNFLKVVEDGWKNQNVYGWMGYVLKEKLKELKSTLRAWAP